MDTSSWIYMVTFLVSVSQLPHASADHNASSLLERVAHTYWNWKIRQFPTIASQFYIPYMDDKLENYSIFAAEERYEYAGSLWHHLQRVNVSELDDNDTLTYDVLTCDLRHLIDGYKYRMYGSVNPINFLQGFHMRKSWIRNTILNTFQSYQRFLKRLESVAVQVDDVIVLMREAVRLNHTNHNVSMTGVVEAVSSELDIPDNETVYFQPFLLPSGLQAAYTPSQWKILVKKALYIISHIIKPAYRRLRDFLIEVYLPATRPGYGVGSMPGGLEYYEACLRFHLTADVSTAEIRDLGLREVERIKTQMYQIIKEQGFKMSLSEFFSFIRDNRTAQFYNRSQDEILEGYKHIIHNVIAPKLPTVLKDMPIEDIQVVPMQIDGPTGSYSHGTFYVNLRQSHKRPTFTMMALALHEANPGHHLQVQYSHHQDVPAFRRYLCCMTYNRVPFAYQWYSAYTEGWGLYAEYLGELMGVYNHSALELFGRYSAEILRACRLVVDTGIHAYGWSREEAIVYLEEHTAIPRRQIEVEVNRYISWPGQACAYKYGEITIQSLREEAQKAMGANFDIREFNHQVLKVGRVPLDVLKKVTRKWIKRSIKNWQAQVSDVSSKSEHLRLQSAFLLFLLACWTGLHL